LPGVVLSGSAGCLGGFPALVPAAGGGLSSWEGELPSFPAAKYGLGGESTPSRAGARSLCQPGQLKLWAGGHFWRRFLRFEQITVCITSCVLLTQ